ncbi:MAG TPA: hypothetical protein DCR44_03760 [Acholeplasmatales bacterium]|nr:MAG: hypothetical protein A2Y16_01405 [Tenericutes bacterium GWF2_57_13]HAQ56499.1 hypothetical protein [Acholeplasmatales bacterium]
MNNVMINTIEKVGKALNESKIRWAIGGSVLLQAAGFAVEPNDLDIIFETRDAEEALEVFEAIGAKHASDPSYHYQSYSFTEMMVGSVEVDLMAGLKIIKDRTPYQYPFDETTPIDLRVIGDVTVPFMSLDDWLVLYFLMPGKVWKAKLIADQFKKTGATHPGRIDQLIHLMGIDLEKAEAIRELLK